MSMAKAVAEHMIKAIEQRDADLFGALFAQDAVAHHPLFPEPVHGRDAIKAGEAALFDAFDNVDVQVRSLFADDRCCCLEVVLTAVHVAPLDAGDGSIPATGRAVTVPATWWLEVGDDGLITEVRDYLDTAGFFRQLGITAG